MAVGVVEQVEEQLVGLVHHLGDPGVAAVHLVDDEDDRHVAVQRLAQHEPRLRQRALRCVDEQHHAVDHGQAALHLTAEVGVAGRVDDVDRHAVRCRRADVPDGRVLGEDGDALLALELAGVHGALVDVLVLTEGAGLPEHRVHQGGLAVVDMGHDGDVSQVGAALHGHGSSLDRGTGAAGEAVSFGEGPDHRDGPVYR